MRVPVVVSRPPCRSAWQGTDLGMLDYAYAVVVNDGLRRAAFGGPQTEDGRLFCKAFLTGLRNGGQTGYRGRMRLWPAVTFAWVVMGWDPKQIPFGLLGAKRPRLWLQCLRPAG